MTNQIINLNTDTTESQKQRILEFLLTGCKLTAMDALKHFGCFRLSNRISELNDEQWNIQVKMIEVKTIYGPKRVAQYSL